MTSSDMLFFIGAVSVITYVSGHIALTFPPARKYAFDFMDNIRTLPPCGVPKGLGPITDLTVGTPVLVQWHTAYPHSGGYRLALLDQNEREIYVFTQSNNGGRYFGAKDPTTLQHNITLPSQECRNCSIQLIRQAGEWYSSCGDYLFHSCADVNILPNNAPSKKCVHGSIDSNGKCVCDLTYVGDQCTFKEDCMSHGDCNNHGTCFKVSTTYYPSNQCYCDPGWFGRNCQLESPIKEKITDFSSYKMTTLSPDYKLYHKILQASNEIEVVMMVRSLTWVGLGWRPASFLSGCQYFPSLPGILPGSGPTSAPGATSEPVNTPEPEATSEPVNTPAPTSPPPCGDRWTYVIGGITYHEVQWTYNAVTDEIIFNVSARTDSTTWAAIGFSNGSIGNFMPGSDVVMGFYNEVNNTFRLTDRQVPSYYARPAKDAVSNVLLISGGYSNGMLKFSFKRKRNTMDPTDFVFSDTSCPYLLIAYGGDYDSIMDEPQKHTSRFYADKRICIKPCAPAATSKPITSPAPTSPPPCGDRWSNVTGGITYHDVQWTYNAVTDEITFNVSARTNSTKWAAIGFSNGSIGNFMPNSDVVMGFYNEVNNTFRLTDRQVPSSRTRPLKDTISNVMLLSGSYSNGMLIFSFKRNRNTTDPTDFVFSDTNCPYLLIAYGGDYNSTADEPLKHTSRFYTDNRICIKPCAPLPTPEATAEPEGTPEGATSEPEGTPEGATSEPGSNSCARLPPGNSDTTGVNPHPMDCVDMVIGTTRGQMSRIGDYYSRDRSTPQFDSFYGGTESLTAALGYEENGYTTIIFRKKMTASERSDLPILNEYMQVIWARGQDFKNYSHSPPTGIDRVPLSDQSNPEYYKEDELKYHGHIGHRGVARINFLEGMVSPTSSCSWGSCTTSNCHMVSWSLDTLTGLINFTITADLEANQWIGLGFNDKQQMANADSIIGWVTTDGQVFLQDMKNPPSYGVPIRDATQNVQDVRGSIINGRTTISFRRPLVTNDANDFQFSTSNCAYFLFPKGGDFDNAAKSFTKHDSTPIISPQKICFPCSNNATTHMYVVEVRLIGIVWNRYYTDTKTDEYQTLKKDIEEGLMAQFKDSPGYQSVWVRRFKSGSVIAEVGIEMTGIETQTKAEVNKVMTDIVTNQKVLSGYSLDNVYPLSLGNALPVDKDQTEPKPAGGQAEEKETHIAVWFIVGIAAGALVLIVIMGLCTCCKNRRPKNPSQKYKHVQEDSIGPKYNDVQYGQQKKVVMNRNGQQTVVKPQPYEKWLEGNKSATNQYENPAYVGEEYKIETSFL